jgi:hypothetical protein
MCEKRKECSYCERCDHRIYKHVSYHRCREVKATKKARYGTCKRGVENLEREYTDELCSVCRKKERGRQRSRGAIEEGPRSRRGERGPEGQALRLPWVESLLRSQPGSEAPTQPLLLGAAPPARIQARTQPQTQPESETESEPENHIERVYEPPLQPQPQAQAQAQPRAQPQPQPPAVPQPQPPPPHQPQPEPELELEVESEPENHIERIFQPTTTFPGILQPEPAAAVQRPPSPAPTYWTDDSFVPAGAVQTPRPGTQAPTIRPGNGSQPDTAAQRPPSPALTYWTDDSFVPAGAVQTPRPPTLRPGNGSQPGGTVQRVPTRAPTVASRAPTVSSVAPTVWTADEWTARR